MAIENFLSNLSKDAETLFGRVKDKATFERVVLASYLIATADGVISNEEKNALTKMVQRKFPRFKIADITATIKHADDVISFDETTGKLEILNEIGKAKGDSADLIARTALLVASSDGNVDQHEKDAILTILERLGLTPSLYGL